MLAVRWAWGSGMIPALSEGRETVKNDRRSPGIK